MRLFFGITLLTAVLCSSCGNDTRSIREYYFPLKQLQDGLVYEYQAVNNDSLAPTRWYFRSLVTDTSIYLTGMNYASDLTPLQFSREEMVKNGMLLQDLFLYETDSTGNQQRIDVEIIAGSVFPFEVRDSGGVFVYEVKWQPPSDPGATITLVKNRRYAGDTTFIFENKRYDTVVFEVRELLSHEQEGFFEREFSTVEWYAKGLGLVYYRKEIAENFVLESRLARRYPMEELEAIFRQKLKE